MQRGRARRRTKEKRENEMNKIVQSSHLSRGISLLIHYIDMQGETDASGRVGKPNKD